MNVGRGLRQPLARILRGTPRNLAMLARRLRAGELVAVPTETVYGLAADALNARACRKIFKVKGRPAADPLIVHIQSMHEFGLVAKTNPAALRLAAAFWPGPLTLVLPKKPVIPEIVTAGRPSVAVRMPSHPLLRRLLKLAARPLAIPSANPFGYVSPTTAEHVRHSLGRGIRHILDGGPARIGVESTIVDLRYPEKPRLLRPGAISRAAIARALGRPVPARAIPERFVTKIRKPRRSGPGQLAPGQLARHYSPHIPIILHPRLSLSAAARAPSNEAWLFLRKPPKPAGPSVFWLDETGDSGRAARRLFSTLRRLDAGPWRIIHAELARGAGLAEAINDRLRRAAGLG
ncbi:MAG: L-threonylcarbamoyladenylate synthase [Opitutaceae bacterium]